VVHHPTGKLPKGTRYFPGTLCGMVAHVTRMLLSLSDACSNTSEVCKLVLFCLEKPHSTYIIQGGQFQLCQPQNVFHFEPPEKHLFSWNNMGWNSVAVCMHLDNDDSNEEEENWEGYHAKWTSAQFNVNFHFWNMFYFVAI
jgi:hypothetical protein